MQNTPRLNTECMPINMYLGSPTQYKLIKILKNGLYLKNILDIFYLELIFILKYYQVVFQPYIHCDELKVKMGRQDWYKIQEYNYATSSVQELRPQKTLFWDELSTQIQLVDLKLPTSGKKLRHRIYNFYIYYQRLKRCKKFVNKYDK